MVKRTRKQRARAPGVEDVTSLKGPIEMVDGNLTIQIPLEAGGDKLIECSRGISEVREGYLRVVIRQWLADKLRIEAGDLVYVSNANGKFNIQPVNPRPIQ
jgi:hypothetical protein